MTGFAVSCIIPVYNEAARLGAVLTAVAGHPMLAEVIVVDDASTDGSAALAAGTAGVTLLRQPVNGGKTRALAAGIAHAHSPHLLLLDGDLTGLTPAHISALIAPVASGQADISISLRGNAPRLWHWIGIDYISGERVLPRALLDGPPDTLHAVPKFGFEVHLNALSIRAAARIRIVPWPEVSSPLKTRKYGVRAGVLAALASIQVALEPSSAWASVSISTAPGPAQTDR